MIYIINLYFKCQQFDPKGSFFQTYLGFLLYWFKCSDFKCGNIPWLRTFQITNSSISCIKKKLGLAFTEGYRTPLLYFTLYQMKKKLSLVSTEGDLTRRFILSLCRIDGYSFHRFEIDLFSRSTLNNFFYWFNSTSNKYYVKIRQSKWVHFNCLF